MAGKTLVINPVGGLANRMRAIASGISLARDLRTDFRIIWLKNWEINASFDDIFLLPEALKGRIRYPSTAEYMLFYSEPRKRNLYLSKLTLGRFGFSFIGVEAPEDMKTLYAQGFMKKDTCYLQGGTNLYPYSEDLYRCLFQPTPEISSAVDANLKRLGEKPCGIHIRRTDNAQSIAGSPDKLFIDEINRILEQAPGTRFYLASDCEATKARFRKKFGSAIITGDTPARRDTVEGIRDAAVELYTLAACHEVIGSWFSSFSEAAAMLGNIPLRQLRR